MDFSELWDLATITEFIRQSDTGHEVKGKDWLLDNLHELCDYLEICEIEDESIFESAQEWIRKLDRMNETYD